METIIRAENLSKWYGNILGISEISLEIKPGILGILGPNGAGKSTFLKIASGQLKPNIGQITIFNMPVFSNHKLFHRIGFCPEYDSYYQQVSAGEFLTFRSKMNGFYGQEAKKKVDEALDIVGLSEWKDKRITSFSLGMRQRLKLASAIIHQPELLILDEPLRSIDPLWRIKIIQLIKTYGQQGKTVLVSSHILPEIEAMTNNIILIHQGKIFAQGNIQDIRNLIDIHPHQISVQCNQHRHLASEFIANPYVLNVDFNDSENRVTFKTNDRDKFYHLLMETIIANNINVEEIVCPDDNLQAVFDYLIER